MTEKKSLFDKLQDFVKKIEEYGKSGYYGELERAMEKDPRMQKIREAIGGRDPTELLSPSGLAGFTKRYADYVVRKTMAEKPAWVAKNLSKDVGDLLKVIAATPERAIRHIKEFSFSPGLETTGSYSRKLLAVYPSPARSLDVSGSTMAGTFAHEAGHGASLPLLGRLIERKWSKNFPRDWYHLSMIGERAYPSFVPEMEGVAEYLGRYIQRRAGVKPIEYFGYGIGQERSYENLMRLGGKNPQNPWFTVYSYLRDLVL